MGSSRLKTVALVILIIAVLLGIVGLGFAYYYYKNTIQTGTTETSEQKYCGCYSVNSSSQCSPEQSFEYSVKQVTTETQTCTSACANETAPNDYYVCRILDNNADGSCPVCPDNSPAAENNGSCVCCSAADLKACAGEEISDVPFCQNVVITNESGVQLASPIDSQGTITVTAYFRKDVLDDLEYSSFKIKANNKELTIDASCTENCTEDSTFFMPSITLLTSDLADADTLNITATAETNSEAEASSVTCTRSYLLLKPGQAYCPTLITNTSDISNLPVSITGLEVPVVNLPSKSEITDIKIEFTFTGISGVEKLTTKSLVDKYNESTQKITLDSAYLNTATNFVESEAFPNINFPANSTASSLEAKISATVIYTVNGEDQATELSCGYDKIKVTRSTSEIDQTEEEETPNIDLNGTDNATPENGGTATSRFTVIKEGTGCVERVSPNNTANFTITITNSDSDAEIVENVLDKLPLGFSYVANSSVINGISFPDSSGVTVNTTGNTQDVTWAISGGWSVNPNQTLIIQFASTVGAQAITGSNDNEVVIEPYNAPADATAIRAVYSLSVQQTCSAPKTGLLDSLYGRVSLGVIALIMGILFYYTSTGQKISENMAYSQPVKSAEKISSSINSNIKDSLNSIKLRLIYPREYFEKKTLRDAEKGKKRKT